VRSPLPLSLQGVDGALVPVGHHRALLRGKSGDSAVRCADTPRGEQREAGVGWARGRVGRIDGALLWWEDDTCRGAAYLNNAFERIAGSHSLRGR